MKKIIAFILTLVTIFAFAACAEKKNDATQVEYTLGAVEGAPTLSVVNIADGFDYSGSDKEYSTRVSVAADADAIKSGMLNGDFDMAIVPLNLAAVLYNNNEKHSFKLASVNIFGVLYMVGTSVIADGDLAVLKGKVVYTVGKGGTPDIVFQNLLKKQNIESEYGDEAITDKVVVKVSTQEEIIAAFNAGTCEYAILGEPAVTGVIGKTKEQGTVIALDLQAEWKKYYGDTDFVQAGLVVNTDKVDIAYATALVEKLKENHDYLYANTDKISDRLKAIGSTKIANLKFNEAILNRCNIGCKNASSLKTEITAFLTANGFSENAPQPVKKLPADDFYLL